MNIDENFYKNLKIERALFDLRRGIPILISLSDDKESENNQLLLWAENFFYKQKPTNYLKFSFQAGTLGLEYENKAFLDVDDKFLKDCLFFIKRAELLPIGYFSKVEEQDKEFINSLSSISISDIQTIIQSDYTVEKIIDTPLPTVYSENVRIHAYRVMPSLYEAYAIVFGDISTLDKVPVRIHAECFTGDLLGSLKCDCGPQLSKACKEFSQTGGVIVYIRQEGRNIGLLNKMRAYDLQHRGLDTVDANLALGFEVDERDYTSAGLILKDLDIKEIVILTNNPKKISALERAGVLVHARQAHYTPTQKFNQNYIATKQKKIGHLPN